MMGDARDGCVSYLSLSPLHLPLMLQPLLESHLQKGETHHKMSAEVCTQLE
jgi:hypothetical protein